MGMGNTCKPMAVSFQCMTKSTTNKKKKDITERKTEVQGDMREREMREIKDSCKNIDIYLSAKHKVRFILFGNLLLLLDNTLPIPSVSIRRLPSPRPHLCSSPNIFLPESTCQPPAHLPASVSPCSHFFIPHSCSSIPSAHSV